MGFLFCAAPEKPHNCNFCNQSFQNILQQMSHYERMSACGVCPVTINKFSMSLPCAFIIYPNILNLFVKIKNNVPNFVQVEMLPWAVPVPIGKSMFHHWSMKPSELTKEKHLIDKLLTEELNEEVFQTLINSKAKFHVRHKYKTSGFMVSKA